MKRISFAANNDDLYYIDAIRKYLDFRFGYSERGKKVPLTDIIKFALEQTSDKVEGIERMYGEDWK